MKISGVIPLRNAAMLGYPYELAIRSMEPLCDEIVVLVDPESEDATLDCIHALQEASAKDFTILFSRWDMSNHQGHTNCEISVQTAKACEEATGDWILSLQADEVLHEDEIQQLRAAISAAESYGATGVELKRLYFYGSLERIREDWTQWLLRLFKRGHWKPDVDGAMKFDPCGTDEMRMRWLGSCIYHYSRIGDPQLIAERVRNLDRFFHAPDKVQAGELPPYDFGALRKLDTYVVGHQAEDDPTAELVPFPIEKHPASAREYFRSLAA